MISIKSNIGIVLGNFAVQLKSIASGENKDKMIRTMATTVIAEIKYRVHTDGTKTDNSAIGTYKNAYLRFRQKPPYNRTGDTKMIFSLTRQMENDFSIVSEDANIGYGIGFKNQFNADKASWLQYGRIAQQVKEHTRVTKKKRTVKVKAHNKKATKGFGEVYMPSQQEIQLMRDVAEDFIGNLVKKK